MDTNLVILASGWTKPDLLWSPLKRLVTKAEYDTEILSYPFRGFAPIQYTAKVAKRQLEPLVKDYDKVIFIGHSMGGLVGRYLVQRLGLTVDTFVSIGTPHQGTYTAYLAPWSKSAHQMKPNSRFITRLNEAPWPIHTRLINVRASTDELVIPATNAEFTTHYPATEIVAPRSTHVTLLLNRRFLQDLLGWIDEPDSQDEHQFPLTMRQAS